MPDLKVGGRFGRLGEEKVLNIPPRLRTDHLQIVRALLQLRMRKQVIAAIVVALS